MRCICSRQNFFRTTIPRERTRSPRYIHNEQREASLVRVEVGRSRINSQVRTTAHTSAIRPSSFFSFFIFPRWWSISPRSRKLDKNIGNPSLFYLGLARAAGFGLALPNTHARAITTTRDHTKASTLRDTQRSEAHNGSLVPSVW